jgi:fructoselysine 6-kinase
MLFEDFGVCRGYRPNTGEVELLRRMRHVHIGWLDDGGELKRTLAAAGVSVSQDLSVNGAAESLRPDGLSIAFASAEGSRERAKTLIDHLLLAGAEVAVVTCGAFGSLASDGVRHAEADVRPTEVVDTLGAGDTFIAGFIAAYLRGYSLAACLEQGRGAAASTCAHLGGFPQVPVPIA